MTRLAARPSTTAHLKKAVHHHKITSKRGVLERMFTMWFRGFVYNQIWEDPRVDAQALQIGPESSLFTISSGGCNVLNYLIHKPKRIVAVDLNHNHMSLTRLKLAAIQHLPDYDSASTRTTSPTTTASSATISTHRRGPIGSRATGPATRSARSGSATSSAASTTRQSWGSFFGSCTAWRGACGVIRHGC